MESVSKDDLVKELSKYGEVANVWVARNPPGFAFVEFSKSTDAEKAVRALDGVTICGSRVRVEFSHGGRSKKTPRTGGRGSRPGGRGFLRRYDSPPRNNGRRSSPYNDSRYSNYDRHKSSYGPETAASAAGFSYGTTGYPPMLPFLQSDDFFRDMDHQSHRRSSPSRIPQHSLQRGRSPISRRRSRSPIGYADNRARGRTPPFYDDRNSGHIPEMRGRSGYGDYVLPIREGCYSPPPFAPQMMNGRRDDSRGRFCPIDRRRH